MMTEKYKVAVVMSQEASIQSLLQLEPQSQHSCTEPFTSELRKDPHVREIIEQLREITTGSRSGTARIAMQGALFNLAVA